jgi:hypothetical protein
MRTGPMYRARTLSLHTNASSSRNMNRLRIACSKGDIVQIRNLLLFDGVATNDKGVLMRGTVQSAIPMGILVKLLPQVVHLHENHIQFVSLVLPAAKLKTASPNNFKRLNGHSNKLLILLASFLSVRHFALSNLIQLHRVLLSILASSEDLQTYTERNASLSMLQGDGGGGSSLPAQSTRRQSTPHLPASQVMQVMNDTAATATSSTTSTHSVNIPGSRRHSITSFFKLSF